MRDDVLDEPGDAVDERPIDDGAGQHGFADGHRRVVDVPRRRRTAVAARRRVGRHRGGRRPRGPFAVGIATFFLIFFHHAVRSGPTRNEETARHRFIY